MPRTIHLALLLALLTLVTSAAQQMAPAGTVTVKKRTTLRLATVNALDPATAKTGDDVPLRLMRPLAAAGVVVLPAGALVHGKVTKVTPRGKDCKSGEVKWKLESITFTDASTAKTKVIFKSERPDEHYEPRKGPRLSTGEIIGYVIQDTVLAPLLAALLVEYGAQWLVTRPFKHNPCSRYTRDFPLPAAATVWAEITEDHAVRY